MIWVSLKLFMLKTQNNIMNYKLEGNGETLVFIHGLSDNLLYWEYLASNLKNNYQILRVDLRGHGESELGSDDVSIDLYVNDLINLLAELNINKVNIIGFSLGGAIAIDFALKYPNMVSSLVLMSSFYKADQHLCDVFNQFKNALYNSFDDFYDLILPMVLCKSVIDENADELEMLKETASDNANRKAFIKAIDACLKFDAGELSQINLPVLILAGRYDDITPLYIQNEISEKITDSKLIIFDNTKHNLLVGKNNNELLDVLKNFFKKV